MAQLSANASYQAGRYSAVGIGAQGGLTLTAEGGGAAPRQHAGRHALAAGYRRRGRGAGARLRQHRSTNRLRQGGGGGRKQLLPQQGQHRSQQLGDNAEATKSVVQATLTEGAIGYRKFDVIAGEKAMAIVKLADGSTPPFGATVLNARKQETGIVNDGGSVYLSGIKPASA
jgi:outer membrane usher protein PapC